VKRANDVQTYVRTDRRTRYLRWS